MQRLLPIIVALLVAILSAFLAVIMGRYGPGAFAVILLYAAVFGFFGHFVLTSERHRIWAIGLFMWPFTFLWIKACEKPVGTALAWWKHGLAPGLAGLSAIFFLGLLASWVRAKPRLGLAVATSLLFLLAWAVALLSSNRGGPDPMRHLLEQWLGLSPDQADAYVFWIRKSIHFLFYGFVALSAMLSASGRHRQLIGLGFAATLAIFDEYRQSAFALRSGSVVDVLLDLSGTVALTTLAIWLGRRHDPGMDLSSKDSTSTL